MATGRRPSGSSNVVLVAGGDDDGTTSGGAVAGTPGSPAPGWRKWVLPGVVVLALALAYALRGVLVPLFFAFLLAYALDPLVDKLERWRVPRPAGAALVLLALAALVVLVAFLAVPMLADEFTDASARLPERLSRVQQGIEDWLIARFNYRLPHTWSELWVKYGPMIRDQLPTATSVITALFGTVNTILVGLGMLIVPVFALYLLVDFNRLVARAGALVPRRWAADVELVAGEIHTTLGKYVRGQLLTNLVLAALYATGLAIVGLRMGVAIGIITGMLAFVPYVGLGTGMVLALAMALLDGTHALVVLGVMGTVGILDAMVVTPRIVGGSVGLRPLEVLLTMMAAATLFGFFGILLAVPLGAVLKILIGHAEHAYLDSAFYRAPPATRRSEAGSGQAT